MRSGNILQFSKSWLKMLVFLTLFVSLALVAGKMGVSKGVGEEMLMFEEEEEEGNLIHARGVKFDFEEVGSEDLQMMNEGEEGWKESVENDEQVEGGSEKSTGLSGGCIQEEEEEDYLQDLRVRDLGLSGGNVQEQEEDEEEEEERVFVSNTDPWLEYRYNVVC